MILKVTLTTGTEYKLDLSINNIDNVKQFGEEVELAPGRMLKVEDNTYIRAGSIISLKELN